MSDIEQTFWNRYDTSQVQVFGINDGESFSTAVNFVNNFGLTYPVLFDQGGWVWGYYPMTGISPYPRDVIVDQNGMVAYMHSEYEPQYMLEKINSLLGINSLSQQQIMFNPQEIDLKIYPNPFNPTTTVSFNVIEDATVKVLVYNVLGQKIQSHQINSDKIRNRASFTMNMHNYPAGVYFLSVINGASMETQKIILLR